MNNERFLTTLLASHISEKGTILVEKNNQYAFKVRSTATKLEIKNAVEFLFNTKVKSVNIVSVKPKNKIFKGIKGQRKGWKKAYVSLDGDQKLDLSGSQ